MLSKTEFQYARFSMTPRKTYRQTYRIILILMASSDDASLALAARNDPQAFAVLYDRYVVRLYAHALHQISGQTHQRLSQPTHVLLHQAGQFSEADLRQIVETEPIDLQGLSRTQVIPVVLVRNSPNTNSGGLSNFGGEITLCLVQDCLKGPAIDCSPFI